jgi:uncharacterized membrane protein YccF (DUF307 family)
MSPTSVIMNLLWLFFGGWTTALSWFTSAFFMLISIVGIPWARAAFNIGLLNFWPFGSEVTYRKKISGSDVGTGVLGTIGNILWLVVSPNSFVLGNCIGNYHCRYSVRHSTLQASRNIYSAYW